MTRTDDFLHVHRPPPRCRETLGIFTGEPYPVPVAKSRDDPAQVSMFDAVADVAPCEGAKS